MTLIQDGVSIRERPITLQLSDGPMCGILTEPTGVPSSGLTAIFFCGGSDRRIGPNRMWVDCARRWAAQGVSAVRLDASGIGDAPGDEHVWDRLVAHYDQRNVRRTLELLDVLGEIGLPSRFMVTGFCSGAYRAIHTAARDRRVAAVCAISIVPALVLADRQRPRLLAIGVGAPAG